MKSRACWMVGSLLLGCGATATEGASDAAGTVEGDASALPDSAVAQGDAGACDPVITPGGMQPRACVHEAPSGSLVVTDDGGGTTVYLDGSVIATYPPCPCTTDCAMTLADYCQRNGCVADWATAQEPGAWCSAAGPQARSVSYDPLCDGYHRVVLNGMAVDDVIFFYYDATTLKLAQIRDNAKFSFACIAADTSVSIDPPACAGGALQTFSCGGDAAAGDASEVDGRP